MRLLSGGQSGVDRAVLDAAIERGLDYAGWCPQGGWAEDFADPPGVLRVYPRLRETPSADPAQRTEWNVRDADLCLILVDQAGVAGSKGTSLAADLARRYRKPLRIVDIGGAEALHDTAAWLAAQRLHWRRGMTLAVGGPRESEAPGIYARARRFLLALLQQQQIGG